jgi:putative glutamine amidotransferase
VRNQRPFNRRMANSVVRIGVTCSLDAIQRPSSRTDHRLRLNMAYIDSVLASGALPVPLTPVQDLSLIAEQLDAVDGLLITGGPDVPPDLYGQSPHPQTTPLCTRRSDYDFAVFAEADKKGLPTLGICLGHQIINVARGGTLIQHLDDVPRTPPIHHGDALEYIRHTVLTQDGSVLQRIVPKPVLEVNSSHHQAIDRIGSDLVAVAWAPDGVIEAIQDTGKPFLLGVQWHPEVITHLQDHAALFRALTSAAAHR